MYVGEDSLHFMGVQGKVFQLFSSQLYSYFVLKVDTGSLRGKCSSRNVLGTTARARFTHSLETILRDCQIVNRCLVFVSSECTWRM